VGDLLLVRIDQRTGFVVPAKAPQRLGLVGDRGVV
jgi:hypothetical protein